MRTGRGATAMLGTVIALLKDDLPLSEDNMLGGDDGQGRMGNAYLGTVVPEYDVLFPRLDDAARRVRRRGCRSLIH